MTEEEFKQLDASLKRPMRLIRPTGDGNKIQVALLDGSWVAYAAMMTADYRFIRMAPEHPVAKQIIGDAKIKLSFE